MLAFVAPAMARRLLDDNVARKKMHRLAIIEFQPQLDVEQDRVVHGLCCVHLRAVALEGIRESRQACEKFLSICGGSDADEAAVFVGGKVTIWRREPSAEGSADFGSSWSTFSGFDSWEPFVDHIYVCSKPATVLNL